MYQVGISSRYGFCVVATFNSYERAWDCVMGLATAYPEGSDSFPVLVDCADVWPATALEN